MILKLIWRNLWRNSRRTLITMGSITFSVLLAILMQSFQKGVFGNLIRNVVGYYSGYVQIHKAGYWDEQVLENGFFLHDSLIRKIKQDERITAITPRVETFVLASGGEVTRGCLLIGTDPESENQLTQLSKKLIRGDYFRRSGEEVLLAEGLAGKLKLDVGDTVVLFGQGFHGAMAAGKYPIRGIVHLASPAMNEAFAYFPLAPAQYFLGAERFLTSISMGLRSPEAAGVVQQSLQTRLGMEFEVMDWKQLMPDIDKHIRADGVNFYIFTGVLYLIIGFGFFGTVMMMTAERWHEFGMLVAIGMKKWWLGIMLLGETLFISFAGILVGVVLSVPLVVYLSMKPIQLTGNLAKAYEQFGFEPIFPTVMDPAIFLIQSLIVLGLAVLVGLYPIWFVHRLNPVTSMKL